MQRRSLLAALALSATACSGGGSAPASPPATQPSSPSTATPKSDSVAVKFVIHIPPATATAAHRKPEYISAGTASIVVSVDGTAGATASATVNVGSSACTASSTGTVCTASVLAPVGSDTFTVTTYESADGTGSVLSTGTIAQTILGTSANVVPIVLNGVIASLTIAIAAAYQPVVDGGTTTATIVAKDAALDTIVGTYSAPIALSAATGLIPTATSVADSSHAAIGLTYDGVSRTALALTATAGNAKATGSVIPMTHEHIYTAPEKIAGGSALFPIIRGPDGAMYFGDLGVSEFFGNSGFTGSSNTGYVGRVDPVSGTIAQVALTGIDPDGLIFVGNDLYIAEAVTGTIGRIAGAASGGFTEANYSELTLPNAPPPPIGENVSGHAFPRRFAYANGILYVASLMDGSIDEIPVAQFATGTSAVTRVIASGRNDRPDGITVGSDGNLYFTTGNNRMVGKLVPGATTTTDSSDTVIAGDPTLLTRFIATGPDGKLYLTATSDPPTTDGIELFDAGAFTQLSVPTGLPEEQPDDIVPGAGTTVVYDDLFNGDVGVYDTSAKTFRVYPVSNNQFSNQLTANDAADGLDGSYWFSLDESANGAPVGLPNIEVGRLVLAQAWELLPQTPLTIDGLGTSGAQLIAVAEAASSKDTVTVVSKTPSICSISAPASFLDTYVVTGNATGTCTVAATDQTNRVQTMTIAVSASNLSISARRRSRNVFSF